MKSENPNNCLEVLILAAGSSSRLGQPKQLVKWHGKTLLENTILAAQKVSRNISIVLGANADKIVPSIEHLDCESLICKNWKDGMGASLSFGVGELLESNPRTEKLLVLVCDQIHVSGDLLEKLVRSHDDSTHLITACRYGDSLGVPAIFNKVIFPELLKLKGESGAKKIIQNNIHRTGFIDFPKGEVDVDKPEDLEL